MAVLYKCNILINNIKSLRFYSKPMIINLLKLGSIIILEIENNLILNLSNNNDFKKFKNIAKNNKFNPINNLKKNNNINKLKFK